MGLAVGGREGIETSFVVGGAWGDASTMGGFGEGDRQFHALVYVDLPK